MAQAAQQSAMDHARYDHSFDTSKGRMQVQELVVKLAAADAALQDDQARAAGLQAAGAELRSELPEVERRVSQLAAECESLQVQLKVGECCFSWWPGSKLCAGLYMVDWKTISCPCLSGLAILDTVNHAF